MSANVAGIDIGDGYLKMALYKKGEARLVSARLPRNLVNDGLIIDHQAMSSFIRKVKKEHHISAPACALVLPDSFSFFRHVSLPAMTEDQLELNLPYEFRDYISGDAKSYFYDYAVKETIYNDAGVPEKIELFAAAVPKSTISEYAGILRRAGFKLKVVLPREMAYVSLLKDYINRNPLCFNQEFCIINIGNFITCIDIYKGSTHVASKVLEFGCHDIDTAVAKVKNIDPFIANSYVQSNYEDVLSLPESMAVYNRISVEIMKVINFYNFSNPESNLQDIYFCGSGAECSQLTDTIDKQTDKKTYSIDTLAPPSVAGSDSLAACTLALAMAMGL